MRLPAGFRRRRRGILLLNANVVLIWVDEDEMLEDFVYGWIIGIPVTLNARAKPLTKRRRTAVVIIGMQVVYTQVRTRHFAQAT